MKSMKPKLISIVVCFCIMGAGVAFAEETGKKIKRKYCRPPKHGHPGLAMLMRFQHDNIAAQVISGITGQSLETITEELNDSHLPEVLETYGVEPETFRSAMDQKVIQLINDAAEAGRITEYQGTEIIYKIENRPSCPGHMKPDLTR